MQSKTTRGVRRLLVSTGVISLVLSVAAPAALAEKPEGTPGKDRDRSGQEHPGLGTTRTLVCHEGRVLEVDDDGALNGHTNHGDQILEGDHEEGEPCENDPIEDDEVVEGDGNNTGGGTGEGDGTGDDEGDGNEDGNAGGNSDGAPGDGNENNPTGQDGTDNGGDDDVVVEGDSTEAPEVTEQPEQQADPEPEPAKPVVIISADTVTKPVVPAVPAQPAAPTRPAVTNTPAPAAPASPSAAPSVNPNRTPEVLGSVTTRTPGGAQVTALAATGTSTTTLLAIVGATLLLAGLGLQALGRRQAGSVIGA
ncbi:hypothetical protein NHL50_03195 [Acidimicrobiia bacterium EGI L10123]|uniref:hypothetical protein n=1 Tax=Salinilacustrithrix flava TaxID=2957203 RepID=UPI003D7C3460|nr:hypothetical protein [Acidimicrobiia bacterium EGI L10123]